MYLMYVSKDFLSLEDVLWLTIATCCDLVVKPRSFRPEESTFVCVHVEALFGAEREFRRERKKNSELLERKKVLLGAKREFEREEEKSQILERKKSKRPRSFLRFLFL